MTAKHSEQITHEAPRELQENYTQGLAAFLKQAGKLLSQAFDAGTDLDKLQQVLEFCKQALQLVREGSDRASKASMLGIIGVTCLRLGKPHHALEYLNGALPIFKEIGDRAREALTLRNIGVTYLRLGKPQLTVEFYTQALQIYRALGDRQGESDMLYYIGSVYKEVISTEVRQLLSKHPEIKRRILESHRRVMSGDETDYVGIEEMEKIFEKNRPQGRTLSGTG